MPRRPKTHGERRRRQQRRQWDREYDQRRGPDRQFYSTTRWRRFRRWFIARNPLCAECLRHGRTRPTAEVDHIIPRREAPERAFDESNCQGLCKTCHSRKTGQEMRDRGRGGEIS